MTDFHTIVQNYQQRSSLDSLPGSPDKLVFILLSSDALANSLGGLIGSKVKGENRLRLHKHISMRMAPSMKQLHTIPNQTKPKQSKAKQSKAKQKEAKQSKANQ